MGFLAKLLGTVGSGGWIIYAVLAAAVFTAGGLSGAKVQRVVDAPTIAQGKTDLAASRLETSQARNALLDQQKATALDLAQASATALAQRQTLDAQVAELNAKLATTERARRAASTKLLDTLKAIPHDQQSTLSPPVRKYLSDVLREQASRTIPAASNDHNENGAPISDRTN